MLVSLRPLKSSYASCHSPSQAYFSFLPSHLQPTCCCVSWHLWQNQKERTAQEGKGPSQGQGLGRRGFACGWCRRCILCKVCQNLWATWPLEEKVAQDSMKETIQKFSACFTHFTWWLSHKLAVAQWLTFSAWRTTCPVWSRCSSTT